MIKIAAMLALAANGVCAAEDDSAAPLRSLDIEVVNGAGTTGDHRPAKVHIDFRQVFGSPDARINPQTLKLWRLDASGQPSGESVPARFDDPDPIPDSFHLAFLGGGGQSGALIFQHEVQEAPVSRYRLQFEPWSGAAGDVPPSPSVQIGDYDILRYATGGPMSGNFHTKIDVCDWDDDGLTDILVGDTLGRITLYRRSGSGVASFDFPRAINSEEKPLKLGGMIAPDAVDWDGDGDLDLIIGDESSGVFLVQNVGSRTHPRLASPAQVMDSSGQPIKSPTAPSPEASFLTKDYTPSPVVFDYNGDRKQDLLLGGYCTGYIFYYENVAASPAEAPVLESRGFLSTSDGKPIDVTWCASPTFADVTGDELPDLIVGHIAEKNPRFGWTDDPSVFFYRNVGTRQQPAWERFDRGFPVGWTDYPPDVTVPRIVDWNGDGAVDLLMGARSEVFYFENAGTSAEPKYEFRQRLTMSNGPLMVAYRFNAVAPWIGDFDGDGLPDLVRGGPGDIAWARMVSFDGAPAFEDVGYLAADGTQIYHEFPLGDDTAFPFPFDINDDGQLDLVVGGGDGYIYLYENIGTKKQPPRFKSSGRLKHADGTPVCVGEPPPDTAHDFETKSGNRATPSPGDYDGDGVIDLICGNAAGEVYYYRGLAGDERRFAAGVKFAAGNNRAFTWPADWDSDGKLDVVVSWAGLPRRIYVNQGAEKSDQMPTFEAIEIENMPWIPYPRPIVIDWNRDGDLDLLFASSYAMLHFAERDFVEQGYAEARVVQP